MYAMETPSARRSFPGGMVSGAPTSTPPVQESAAIMESKAERGRFLITMGAGIGDAVVVGLSALDQIIENDPEASGHIDVLCNSLQAQIFEEDPRLNRAMQTETLFFAGSRITEWPRAILLDADGARVARFLRERHYEAVFPSMVAPGLYHALHTQMMYPDLFQLGRDLLARRAPSDLPVYQLVRHIVNRYFHNDAPPWALSEEIPLYLGTRHIQQAVTVLERLKKRASPRRESAQVMLVAADSKSPVTRPPTHLLATALAVVLRRYDDLLVCILPGYTDTAAADSLKNALLPDFAGRVFTLSAEPKPSLLETAALIDQADILVTGDTGVMHLAATTKRVRQAGAGLYAPRNAVKIIALFGGSNPDVWGYQQRTTIVGRGRKEQRTFSPGFVKELYRPKGKDFFDHISPHQLAEAIARQVTPPDSSGRLTSPSCSPRDAVLAL
jgi:ADP-heptose:LPS heptosyltransferase